MKKNRMYLAALVCAVVAFGCSKEIDNPSQEPVKPSDEQVKPETEVKTVTISATLVGTKVTFDPSYDAQLNPTGMAHKWQAGDQLRVTEVGNDSNTALFDLIEGEDTAQGRFQGEIADAAAYNLEVVPAGSPSEGTTQTQEMDGYTSHLKFVAGKSGVTDLSEPISLTETSSIIGIIVQLPKNVTETIDEVEIVKSTDDFATSSTLVINLEAQADTDADNVLKLYANIPSGWEVEAGTKMFLKFKSTDDTHKVYTRYQEFATAFDIQQGKFNYLKLNCLNTDKYAGNYSDDGTSAHPYLIADPYQVAAINELAAKGSTTYFKMIADVDMTGVTHTPINDDGTTSPTYNRVVIFDGNNKTISNLGANLFYVFKGSIQNLTLSGSSVGNKRGIFAEYCQGTGHTITNVDITGGSMATTSNNGGAMIGRINSGSGTTVTITDCDVTNTTVSGAAQTGGLIGSADVAVVVNNCTVAKFGEGTSSVTASGANCGGLIGQTTGTVTITDCTVSGTNVTGAGVVGGVVGFANSLVTVSGSKYTGGTVTASGRYVGGFLGSTKDVASVITDCQVEEATVNANYTADARGGGFVGQLQTSCRIEGCTVGTSSAKVTVASKEPTKTDNKYNVINVGGFVGVNYGTITKNGEVRSKAYVKLTSTNNQGTPLNLGGFVGFGRGTIEYCDAVVDMTSLKGQYIGGFAGYVTNAGTKIDNCTVDGPVTGNNYTGGFAGYVDSGAPVISNCTASGSVTAQSGCGGFVGQTMTGVFTNCSTSATCSFSGSNNGGFAGQIHGGSLTGCSESGNVTATGGSTYGGFAGLITNNGTTLTKCSATGNVEDNQGQFNGGFIGSINQGTVNITKCFASGNVTSNKGSASAFIAVINQGSNTVNATVENCYAVGNIINSNQIRGGFIGAVTAVTSLTISNCYASGAVVGSFRLGGLIGNLQTSTPIVSKCVAWNSEVTASSHGQTNWSSGAVIGTAHPNANVSDCYRNPGMSLTVYCPPPASDWNHPDIDGTTHPLYQNSQAAPFTWAESTFTALSAGTNNVDAGRWAYHGKVQAGKTLSQLASTTLGWSSDVWDFTGDLPTLK